MRYVIANWKAHKTRAEVDEWLNTYCSWARNAPELDAVSVLIAPPSLHLSYVSAWLQYEHIHNTFVAAQDISLNAIGAYTGSLPPELLKGTADFFIANHSERYTKLGETEETGFEKAMHGSSQGLRSILCIEGCSRPIPPNITIVAYEPLSAIGTGNNARIEDVLAVKRSLGFKGVFLYGGSVTPENIDTYLISDIDGFLVGSSSLPVDTFISLIKACA